MSRGVRWDGGHQYVRKCSFFLTLQGSHTATSQPRTGAQRASRKPRWPVRSIAGEPTGGPIAAAPRWTDRTYATQIHMPIRRTRWSRPSLAGGEGRSPAGARVARVRCGQWRASEGFAIVDMPLRFGARNLDCKTSNLPGPHRQIAPEYSPRTIIQPF